MNITVTPRLLVLTVTLATAGASIPEVAQARCGGLRADAAMVRGFDLLAAERCREARPCFDAAERNPTYRARATYGRALCAANWSDASAASAAFELLVEAWSLAGPDFKPVIGETVVEWAIRMSGDPMYTRERRCGFATVAMGTAQLAAHREDAMQAYRRQCTSRGGATAEPEPRPRDTADARRRAAARAAAEREAERRRSPPRVERDVRPPARRRTEAAAPPPPTDDDDPPQYDGNIEEWFSFRLLAGLSLLGLTSSTISPPWDYLALGVELGFVTLLWEEWYWEVLRIGGGLPMVLMWGTGAGYRLQLAPGSELRVGLHVTMLVIIPTLSGVELAWVNRLSEDTAVELGLKFFSYPTALTGSVGFRF